MAIRKPLAEARREEQERAAEHERQRLRSVEQRRWDAIYGPYVGQPTATVGIPDPRPGNLPTAVSGGQVAATGGAQTGPQFYGFDDYTKLQQSLFDEAMAQIAPQFANMGTLSSSAFASATATAQAQAARTRWGLEQREQERKTDWEFRRWVEQRSGRQFSQNITLQYAQMQQQYAMAKAQWEYTYRQNMGATNWQTDKKMEDQFSSAYVTPYKREQMQQDREQMQQGGTATGFESDLESLAARGWTGRDL